ncbi:hypothetical protein [Longimycelium tulufanense]|uniref:hypothetical protein n=1 Tax=Longimycelium tulufanense TaxID=907463 RepID=UPI00166AFC18|nr:hypothetical protein [Longimycelium tulufanense]
MPQLRTSPCEHDVVVHVLTLPEGSTFSVPECRTKAGVPRTHVVTRERYPLVRR